MTASLSAPSLTGSWADDLPPAEDEAVLPEPAPPTPDKIGSVPTTPGTCAACGEIIIREPGTRGRLPKYHPECRPLKSATTNIGGTSSGGRTSKAEREADEAIEAFKSVVVKGVIMLSMVEKYDAFVIMVQLPQICENLRGVLLRYEGFRREMLALKGGGSIFALILSVLMLFLPMAAHHGLIRGKMIAEVLMKAPFTMHKIQMKLAEGTESLTRLMEEQLMQQRPKAKPDGNVNETGTP